MAGEGFEPSHGPSLAGCADALRTRPRRGDLAGRRAHRRGGRGGRSGFAAPARTLVFVTNNSSQPVGEVEAKLAAHGIPADGDVITSAMAAADARRARRARPRVRRRRAWSRPSRRAARSRCATATPTRSSSGFHRDFDYERLRIAARAVRRGARLLATNDDSTYPTPDGPIPGGGAILAAVVTATGRRAGGGRASRTRRWPRWCGARLGDGRGHGRGPARHRRALRRAPSATGSRSSTPASRPPACRSTRRPTWWRRDLRQPGRQAAVLTLAST